MINYETKVDKLHIPKGTKVIYNDDPKHNNIGKTGQLLCNIPTGGSLFYKEDELKKID